MSHNPSIQSLRLTADSQPVGRDPVVTDDLDPPAGTAANTPRFGACDSRPGRPCQPDRTRRLRNGTLLDVLCRINCRIWTKPEIDGNTVAR